MAVAVEASEVLGQLWTYLILEQNEQDVQRRVVQGVGGREGSSSP